MEQKLFKDLFKTHKEQALFGRYITLADINPLINKLPSHVMIDVIGQSVLGRAIHTITIGSGPKKY
ncbi:MAG: hypothetical protein WBF67_02115 [Olleya sp.]